METKKSTEEPLFLPGECFPDFRKPDPKIYTPEEIERFEQAAKKISAKHNKFSEGEILERIVTVSDAIKNISDYTERKNEGESLILELASLQKFLKSLKPGDIRNLKIKITLSSLQGNTDLQINNPDILNMIIEVLPKALIPFGKFPFQREQKKRGGQIGGPLLKQILREQARDLYSSYRRSLDSDSSVYEMIGNIFIASGCYAEGEGSVYQKKKRLKDYIKHLVSKNTW